MCVGPRQTLSLLRHPDGLESVNHEDLHNDMLEPPCGFPSYLSNYGPHVSMYMANLASTYERANKLSLAYVNPRFKRRAYTLEQALDDCMFGCLDVIDPDDLDGGTMLRHEHEIRSVMKPDGTLYKSYPFREIPPTCKK